MALRARRAASRGLSPEPARPQDKPLPKAQPPAQQAAAAEEEEEDMWGVSQLLDLLRCASLYLLNWA